MKKKMNNTGDDWNKILKTEQEMMKDHKEKADSPPTVESIINEGIRSDKKLRKDLDPILQRLKNLPKSRERSLAITKLQEAIMWLGMDLKLLGDANPYPNSRNPENTIVDKTADNLKL